MVESFYSLWTPEAKHIVTIVDIPIEEHNSVYLEIVGLAVTIYGNEVLPFILNVGTVGLATDSEDLSDDLLGFPKFY